MSCIWIESPAGGWQSRPLLAGRLEPIVEGAVVVTVARSAALLVRPGVFARVNGEPVLGGLRILDHRDEILLGSSRMFFSAQSAPEVADFSPTPGERPPVCPVCRGPVREGMHAVRCPGCARWFHQLETKQCWTYAPTCRFCKHPTAFTTEAAWRPGREEALV